MALWNVCFIADDSEGATDLTLWYAGRTIFAVGLVAALGFYGLRTALAGRPIFAPSDLGRLDGS